MNMLRYFTLLSLLFLFACGKKETPSATLQEQTGDERIAVKVVQVTQKNITLPVHSSGILSSTAEQKLSFKTGGIVRRIYFEEGDVVRPGQLLAILDKTEIDAMVSQAEQSLAKSERDLARVQGLYQDSSATLELLQNATTGRDVAKETLRIALFNRQYSEIRATRGGTIIKKIVNEGEIVGPGMPVFVLFETGQNDWVVKINVSDRDWARLNKGQVAEVHFDAYSDTNFKGTIADLPAAADPSNGLYPIEVKVTPQGKRFAPGLFAQVDIASRQGRNYVIVPIESIIEGEGKSAFVYTVSADGASVKKVPVQIAFLEGSTAVIASGLEASQRVVTTGAPYLNERKKIRIVE
jgi:multidrug efflux system membrane fusion protein